MELRDKLDLSEKDVIPIWLIGDSFTEGCGVALDDTYAKRLEVGLGVKVLNLGVASIGTNEAIVLIERDPIRFSHPPGFFTDKVRSQGAHSLTTSKGFALDRGRSVIAGEFEIRINSPEGQEVSKIEYMAFHPPFRSGLAFFINKKVSKLAASRLFSFQACLDLLREFRRFSNHQQSILYCSSDAYWRPFGHRTVAEGLVRKIKSEIGDAFEAEVPR